MTSYYISVTTNDDEYYWDASRSCFVLAELNKPKTYSSKAVADEIASILDFNIASYGFRGCDVLVFEFNQ